VRIRNHLLAKYFPELDRYYERSESGSLAIVRWCLDPSVIAGLEYKVFAQRVAPRKRRLSQESRLQAIWKLAVDSIGCEVGSSVEFEGKVMVEGLKQIREVIRATEEKIEEICSQYAEYSGFWSRCFGEGSGGDWRSVSLSEWEAGFEAGGFGSKRGAQWQDFGGRGAGYFQERESGSSVRLVPGGFHCFDQESRLYGLLHPQAPGSRKRAWDQDEDAREVGSQAFDHGLDFDEEKGAF
jgi:hypothetical protein